MKHVAPVAPSNAKCPVEAVDPDTGEILGVYPFPYLLAVSRSKIAHPVKLCQPRKQNYEKPLFC